MASSSDPFQCSSHSLVASSIVYQADAGHVKRSSFIPSCHCVAETVIMQMGFTGGVLNCENNPPQRSLSSALNLKTLAA